ncbi:glycosyltransferase [candidate division KSB1 bacterium]|nr:glycosyltransferase [candidate division KSB1 bacterium]
MKPLVSIVLPCLNEEETVGLCVRKARQTLSRLGLHGEVIVADNGSTDRSIDIAIQEGARVITESRKGYGSAYRAGIKAAKGKLIVMADSDDSYDLTDLKRFIDPLLNGTDFVIGDRLRGHIEKGAMPWLHRYIGNPILTRLLNIFFRAKIGDAHCGMRSFTKDAYHSMNLQTTGMEFASEMIIKALQRDLRIKQIPVTLNPDGRSRPPHLRSFRDGWRHLRFMLLYSPTYLYFWPGFSLFLLGMSAMFALLPGPVQLFGRMVDLHVMVLGSMMAVLGFQIINIGLFAKIYAMTHQYANQNKSWSRAFGLFNLERGLVLGAIIFAVGFMTDLYILIEWITNDFGPLNRVRLALVASTLMIIGAQVLFSSFFLSMLGIERRPMNSNGTDVV